MKVTIFGTGYVGLVTGACLAEVGNEVLCMDIDAAKIEQIKKGIIPIYEPGLEALVEKNIATAHLQFTSDAQLAVDHGQLLFIAVGTPLDEKGSADLGAVMAVADTIASKIKSYKVVVSKSTVPPGTADIIEDKIEEKIKTVLNQQASAIGFDVVSNPEFLKEGAAIADFMKPDRIVVGTASDKAKELLRDLYAPFNRNHDRLIFMSRSSAELTKYAANAMLATKISFMNEIANIAEKFGADIEQIRQGIGSDSRIGFSNIYAGSGYGGSCFPKDVTTLGTVASAMGYEAQLLKAVDDVNSRQKQRLFAKINDYFKTEFKTELQGKTIALWGLSFKPNTDDMRYASSRTLMEALWQAGAKVQAYDPVASEAAGKIYGARDDLIFCATPEAALENADALALVTEWRVFQSPDFDRVKALLNNPVIFDGRNIYDPEMLASKGITYFGIGRSQEAG